MSQPFIDLRKCDETISSVRMKSNKTTHKYGIQSARSIAETIRINLENKNTLWRDSIDLEMNTILAAFDILPAAQNPPPGNTKSSCHIIFDVKMDFIRKSRRIKDGHLTRDPIESNFTGVVSHESVCIAFTYAALNELEVCACRY